MPDYGIGEGSNSSDKYSLIYDGTGLGIQGITVGEMSLIQPCEAESGEKSGVLGGSYP